VRAKSRASFKSHPPKRPMEADIALINLVFEERHDEGSHARRCQQGGPREGRQGYPVRVGHDLLFPRVFLETLTDHLSSNVEAPYWRQGSGLTLLRRPASCGEAFLPSSARVGAQGCAPHAGASGEGSSPSNWGGVHIGSCYGLWYGGELIAG